jgi:hypothetical protein
LRKICLSSIRPSRAEDASLKNDATNPSAACHHVIFLAGARRAYRGYGQMFLESLK